METSQPLSIESFSYSWLVNIRSRGNSLDASDEVSFIEMDPTLPPSKRFFTNNPQDFKFDPFPFSPSSLTFLHADQLISNGCLMPATKFNSTISEASPTVKLTDPPQKSECSSLRKSYRRFSRQVFEKYLNFLRPLCRKFQGLRTSVKNEKIEGSRSVKNWVCSIETPPRVSIAQSCDSESSIYEAVLHCKRSNIGKSGYFSQENGEKER